MLGTFFVAELIRLADGLSRLLKASQSNPIYLAARGVYAFLVCLKLEDRK
jgi:hypothetical protein